MRYSSALLTTLYVLASCASPKNNPETDDTTVMEPTFETSARDSTAIEAVKEVVVGGTTDIYLDYKSYLVSEEGIAQDDIQNIDSTCAISIWPTDEQLDSKKLGIQTQEEEDQFEIAADDFGYYMHEATVNLDTLRVKVIDAKKRYLKLKGLHTTWVLDIRKEGAPKWNFMFFNIGKEPKVVSFWEIAEDDSKSKIQQYFDLK